MSDSRSICPVCGVQNETVVYHLNAPAEFTTCGHKWMPTLLAASLAKRGRQWVNLLPDHLREGKP